MEELLLQQEQLALTEIHLYLHLWIISQVVFVTFLIPLPISNVSILPTEWDS